jgi:hypothetical protein
MRLFSIVKDEGFKVLMKTGRPEYYLPSKRTVARDVKEVFKSTHKHIAKMLQVNILFAVTRLKSFENPHRSTMAP